MMCPLKPPSTSNISTEPKKLAMIDGNITNKWKHHETCITLSSTLSSDPIQRPFKEIPVLEDFAVLPGFQLSILIFQFFLVSPAGNAAVTLGFKAKAWEAGVGAISICQGYTKPIPNMLMKQP